MNRLITDRTDADVEYAKANQSSTEFLKGAYNYTDLNRVEEWCEYLQSQLAEMGYVTEIITKTNWSESDFPTEAELERVRTNISTLKEAFYSITNVPTTLKNMTYKKANDIEKILQEIYDYARGTRNWYVHSGVANAGQSRLFQHRFR